MFSFSVAGLDFTIMFIFLIVMKNRTHVHLKLRFGFYNNVYIFIRTEKQNTIMFIQNYEHIVNRKKASPWFFMKRILTFETRKYGNGLNSLTALTLVKLLMSDAHELMHKFILSVACHFAISLQLSTLGGFSCHVKCAMLCQV